MPELSRASLRYIAQLTPHTRLHALQLLQDHPQLQVSSGLRSVEHNRRVGGVPTSWHLKGRAIDIVGPLVELQRAAEQAWKLRVGAHCTGPEEVLLEHSGLMGQHLHVAW